MNKGENIMRTKKTVQAKLKDFSSYCVIDPVNEKCKKILNSNLEDDLKIELIGILKAPTQTIQPYEPHIIWNGYHPADSKVEITCSGE